MREYKRERESEKRKFNMRGRQSNDIFYSYEYMFKNFISERIFRENELTLREERKASKNKNSEFKL